MRLIKQVTLEYRQGTSDKVYEVDLCEVGAGQFVVNFRYGRRGSTLRDGTKTTTPVSEVDAERIFDGLVESKVSRGYSDAASSSASEPSPEEPSPAGDPASTDDPRREAVLQRLAAGHQSSSRWRLSRAAWRAGEMRLRDAEPLLLELIGSGDAMLDYCIAWSLGQLGSSRSLPALRQLEADRDCADAVRRIAAVAILQVVSGAEREQEIEDCFQQLPASLGELARSGPDDSFTKGLTDHLQNGEPEDFGVLEVFYLIGGERIRAALLDLIRTAPLQPNFFQRFRHIFKAAEACRDAEFFGAMAHRIETSSPMFRMPDSWYFHYSKEKKPTLGPRAEKAFSSQTRLYLRRRIWWFLSRIGELDDADYVRLATGLLLAFTDENAQEPRSSVSYDWDGGHLVPIETHFDRFGNYWAFNYILFGNSQRYSPDHTRRYFCCMPGNMPGSAEVVEREESFPHLWQDNPESVVELIAGSRCEVVHQFAVKVLRDCPEFCQRMDLNTLVMMLAVPYEVTVEFAFNVAVKRYDSAKPQIDLILALANCAFAAARRQGHQWIEDQRRLIAEDSDALVQLVASPFADTRSFARDSLRQIMLPDSQAQLVIGKLVALLHTLGGDDGPVAGDVAETMLRVFSGTLRNIGSDVIRDLLGHALPELQQFAGDLVLAHATLSRDPPPDVVRALLEAEHPSVRGIGVRIIGQLPAHVLKRSAALLIELTRHPQADIRNAIRETVRSLAKADRAFGRSLASDLVEALLIPGAAEGVPSHTSRVLCEDLRDCLDTVPAELVWRLLQSRSAPAQEVGGVLLPTNVKTEDLDIDKIVQLAEHQVLSIREAAWQMCSEQVDRMQSDCEAAAKILDSRWEDSRRFGFQFFRDKFAETGALTPNVLVGICDSVRPDVQQFGREMITRCFQQEHGEEFVLKLSEHPTEAMQLFASNFLEQHASGSADRLRQMAPYFVSVLSRVNKGRVAKERALNFLVDEAMKSESAASIVAEILTRLSATAAIGDRASCIDAMLQIQAAFPSIHLPIRVGRVEERHGV